MCVVSGVGYRGVGVLGGRGCGTVLCVSSLGVVSLTDVSVLVRLSDSDRWLCVCVAK